MSGSVTKGSVVAWIDQGRLAFGIVSAEEKRRVVVVTKGGREERLGPGRIAFLLVDGGPVPGRDLSARRAAGERAANVAERVLGLAACIDVGAAWDLAVESNGLLTEDDLAQLTVGSRDPCARAALAEAFLSDGVRFVRRGQEWEPRSPEVVRSMLAQRETEARRARERDAVFRVFAAVARGEPFEASRSETERRYLEALEELAVHGVRASAPARGAATEAIEAAGIRADRPDEGAFRLLRLVGRFTSDDENLERLRLGLEPGFDADVLRAAASSRDAGFSREGRRDLTGLEVVTIDGARTREIDDGLSFALLPNGVRRVGVHIADPSCFFVPGDAVDREALNRGVSHYLPDGRIPMLPEPIGDDAASLVEGNERPAVTFLVDTDADGRVVAVSVVRSVVRSRARLTYDAVDETIAAGAGPHASLLASLLDVADRRQECRARAGAVPIAMPDVDVHVEEDGRIALGRRDPGSPAQRLVQEAMVLASAGAAAFCIERRIRVPFRRQPAPDRPIVVEPGLDPRVAARRVRRSLRRGEVSLEPGRHFALGLDAYTQVTSPLRRFQDLVAHRQILSALDGEPPAYDEESLKRVVATTERAETEGRRAERECDRYWLLRYLERLDGAEVEGIVVDLRAHPIVLLTETGLEQAVPALASASVGDRVALRIDRVNPRADLLVLRPA